MAFGLSPKFKQEFALDDLTIEQSLAISIEVAKFLNWDISIVTATGFIAYTPLSMSSYSEEIKIKIGESSGTIESTCTGNQMMDWGKNRKNTEKFIDTFIDIKNSYSAEQLSILYESLRQDFNTENQIELSDQSPLSTKEKISHFFTLFIPTKGYYITPIIINLNIAVFILMVVSGANIFLPSSETLLKWGANFRPTTLDGEWWRLLTSCFLHIGILHLLLNMYALLYIGLLLEPYLGKVNFLIAYLLTGIAASTVSLSWHELTISAGASGAIFGMYGVFLALLTTNLIEKSARKALLTSIGIFVAYNIMNGFKPNSGVDNAAHIGGLISGLVIGFALIPGLKKNNTQQYPYIIPAVLISINLAASFYVYFKTPNDIGQYDKKIQAFVEMEAKALKIYQMPQSSPKDSLLYAIKENGIYYWNENIKLLNEIDKLNLPDLIHKRNQKLLQYCDLRLKSYFLIYKAVDEDTDIYRDSIGIYSRDIEALVKELTGK